MTKQSAADSSHRVICYRCQQPVDRQRAWEWRGELFHPDCLLPEFTFQPYKVDINQGNRSSERLK